MRLLALAAAALLAGTVAHAQDSAANGSAASAAGSEMMGALAASGVQTASAVAVVPASVAGAGLIVAGGSVAAGGSVLTDGAGASARAAGGFDGRPLRVDRRVVVAQPRPSVPYAPAETPRP